MNYKFSAFCFQTSETWCWRRMEKISWTDRVWNEVLHAFNEGNAYPK